MVFVSRHFDSGDERQHYRGVWDYLIKAFATEMELLRPVTLVVWGRQQVDRGGLHRIPDGFTEYGIVLPGTAQA
jgi:hypothetical protein